MPIEEIKKALREVRRICEATRFCKDCPLSVGMVCPMIDCDGFPATYPQEWVLNWNDDKKE